ncbi:MAG: N-acetyltransferase family protein [Rhizobiaceae bacterium]|jgi:phosphinothricin acetyltransferase|nr:N-acetyltransferase family protein [Rhizobiaceae bacterium]
MLIRDCQPADMPAVTAIYEHAVLNHAATYELEPPSLETMSARRETILRRGFPYIVAEDAGIVLGFAYGNMFRERLAYRFMVEDSIYLAPEAQKKGVGSALLGELLTQCEARGFRQMIAVIGDAEKSLGSIGVHTRLGFAVTGRINGSGYKFGRWLDTLIMQKALGEGRDSQPDHLSMAGVLQP